MKEGAKEGTLVPEDNDFTKKDFGTFIPWNLMKFSKHCRKNVFYENGSYPDGIYLFKVENGNTRTICEICLKLTIETSDGYNRLLSTIFIINFE